MKATSLMDFIYELRLRANYDSLDEYASDTADADVQRYQHGMLFLLRTGMVLAEIEIAEFSGVDALVSAAESWLPGARRTGDWAVRCLEGRVEILVSMKSRT